MSYPWSILGLDGPASEAEIKRAYARRLKVVRPDGDADAFQELVGARAFALDLASAPYLETVTADSDAATDGAPEHAILLDDHALHIADFEQPASRGDGPFFFMAPPISPSEASPEPLRSEGVEGIRRRLQALEKSVILRFPLPPEWSDLLKEITLLPVGDLRGIEKPLVQALARIVLSSEVFKPAPFLSRFTRTGQFRVASRFHDPRYVDLLTGFDALFGWSESDAGLFDVLPHTQALEFLDHLRAARRAQRVRSSRAPTLMGEGGLPDLSYDDLAESFSGDLLSNMLAIQGEIRRTGEWPRDFRLKALLLAPLVALVYQRKLVALLWCILVLAALVSPGLGASLVDPEWRIAFAAATLLPIFAALCTIHLHIADYWYRGPLAQAQKRIGRADRAGIFNPVLRRTYLMGHRPDLMGLPRSKPAERGGGSYWWIFILIFLILKLAGVFFGGR
jgi:hypothetical protein